MDDSAVIYIHTSASKSQIFVLISLQPDRLTYDTLKLLKSQLLSFQLTICFFFFSSGIWIVLMWKNYPSGAWSWLKLTLYVICKEKCNHRVIVSVATANPPLRLSLSVWYCVSSLRFIFSLFPSIILLSTCLVFLFLSFSLSPHFMLVDFVTFSLSVLVVSCSFVSLSLPLWAVCFVISFSVPVFLHTVIDTHTNTDINKSSFCEVPEVRDEYDFQNPQKSHLHRIFTVHYFTWKIMLAHLAKSSKLAHQSFQGFIRGFGTVFRQRCT